MFLAVQLRCFEAILFSYSSCSPQCVITKKNFGFHLDLVKTQIYGLADEWFFCGCALATLLKSGVKYQPFEESLMQVMLFLQKKTLQLRIKLQTWA
jgi:hypothetical protein